MGAMNCISVYQVFTEITWEGLFTFLLGRYDGILGLGFQDIAIGGVTSVWYVACLICDLFLDIIVLISGVTCTKLYVCPIQSSQIKKKKKLFIEISIFCF